MADCMRVAFIALAPFIGGSERSLQCILLEAAKSSRIEPYLVCPPNSPMFLWATTNGIKTTPVELDLALHSSLQKARTMLRIIWILFLYKIDVVHSNQIWSYPICALPAKLLKKKLVCHLRDPIANDVSWWFKIKPDAVIAVSQYINNSLKGLYTEHSEILIKVMINPVTSQNISKKRELTTNQKHTIVFGFIGQIAPVKGVIETLEIMSKVTDLDWTFLVAGEDNSLDGNYLSSCKKKAKQLGIANRVHFLGFLDNTSEFYAVIDCILMFSKQEPLGRVPLEAGMHDVPSIVSNVGGLPEVVIDKESGYVCDTNNVDFIVNILNNLTKKKLIVMGKRAKSFAVENATSEKYVLDLINFYKEINKAAK
ncbi:MULTISPECIES: glycosyltransferase family 4 protein [unclassified Alteromonas]|uniref:glycosyltransferase family 4 protein n=1 Tax=unclassified Alteromonas TaxID=2614992 RepID=UPI000509B7BF|nr:MULTISPECIES: glycosyltransferase family 4 protein [unclassified Alteromonas]